MIKKENITNTWKYSLFILPLLISAGCGGGGGSGTETTSAATNIADLKVTVKNKDGNVIEGANVSFKNESALSNESGIASMVMQPNDQGKITVSAAGYIKQQQNTDIGDLNSQTDQIITLIPSIKAGTVDAGQGGTITGTTGASVTVTADSLVDSNDNIITGDVDVYITPVDVSDEEERMLFPGNFEARSEDGREQTIHSYGMVDFSFFQGNSELDLKAGSTAEIEIPMNLTLMPTDDGVGQELSAGDTTPLWYYNYDEEKWIEEGVGNIESDGNGGLKTVGTVTHFTPWNSDGMANNAHVKVQLKCRDISTNQEEWVSSALVTWSSSYFGYASRQPYKQGWDGLVGDTMPGETCWTIDEAKCANSTSVYTSPKKCVTLGANGKHTDTIYFDYSIEPI